MKKLALLFLFLFGAAALAQEEGLPRIAVYVTGDDIHGNMKTALGTRMLASLVNSGRYSGIERSQAFLAEIDREHIKQRSGEVDDNQISSLGRQFGVKFVCIVNITPILGDFQVSARIVNVETAEIAFIGESSGPLKTVDDLESVSDRVVDGMFGGKASRARKPVLAPAPITRAQQPTAEPRRDVPAPAPAAPEVRPAERDGPPLVEADKAARNNRKHDLYLTLRYLPIAGPVYVKPLAYNLEVGGIWRGGFFCGVDGGYASYETNNEVAEFMGFYASAGSVSELTPEIKFAYGISAGYGFTKHHDNDGRLPSYDDSNVLILGPFIRLRLRVVELSYRIFFGNRKWDNNYTSGVYDTGADIGVSHELGIGVYFEGSKRK